MTARSRAAPDLALPSLKRRIHVPTEVSSLVRALGDLANDDPVVIALLLDPPLSPVLSPLELLLLGAVGVPLDGELVALSLLLEPEEPIFSLLEEAMCRDAQAALAKWVLHAGSQPPQPYPRLSFSTLDPIKAVNELRFTVDQLRRVHAALRLPDVLISTGSDGRGHCVRFRSEEALIILLYRFAFPRRLQSMESIFGRDMTTLSRIINTAATTIFIRIRRLLAFSPSSFSREAVHGFREPVQRWMGWRDNTTAAAHAAYPAFWLDGTTVEVARPGGIDYTQRCLWSGKDRAHCLKYIVAVTPDGILHVSPPTTGARHDAAAAEDSGFLQLAEQSMLAATTSDYRPFGYGDSAFARTPTLLTVSRGYICTPQHLLVEGMLIASRATIENCFAFAKTNFQFLQWALGLRLLLSPVNTLLSCAWFFVNCMTCVRGGNPVSMRFGVMPPSIETYLRQLDE